MELSKIASAVYNDLESGLSGFNANPNISLEQLEDECIETRLAVIKEWYLKNLIKPHDLMFALNCVDVDCEDPTKCCEDSGKRSMHFEIPQLMTDLGEDAIEYIGAADRSQQYNVYFSPIAIKMHQFKRRRSDEPFVYIEKTPNKNDMFDGWIYNAPFVKRIAVIAIFKDPRQLEQFDCCNQFDKSYLDFGPISNEVKNRLTKTKFYYYRQAAVPPIPNTQIPR